MLSGLVSDAGHSVKAERGHSSAARWLALTAAILGWMFDGLEMGLFPLVARPALIELLGAGATDRFGIWMASIIALFLAGAALGGVLFGWLGDRIGRIRAMIWTVLTYSVFSGLCAFANEPWHIAALRTIAALGMGGEWALGVALVSELFAERQRPVIAGLIGAAANFGFLGIALLSLGLNAFIGSVGAVLQSVLPEAWAEVLLKNGAWRMMFLLAALPVLLTLFIRLFAPESELWKQAAGSGASKVHIGEIFQRGRARVTILAALLAAVPLLGTWGSVQWIPSWGDKLSGGGPGVRETLQIYIASGAIIFTIATALVAQWLNRRVTYFVISLLALVACGVLFRIPMEYGGWLFLWTFLVGGLASSFYGWLPLYLPEIFPTRLRATGAGFAFNAGRVLAAGGTLISGQLLAAFAEDYAQMCAVISLVYVLGLILIWFAPETKGQPLPA